MTFWQENYAFIKDVYDMRHHKMAEWMGNGEKVGVIWLLVVINLSQEILNDLHYSLYLPARSWKCPVSSILFPAGGQDKAGQGMIMSLYLQAISRIMADKVYTSAEFKRERDNFHVSSFYFQWSV